MDETGGKTDGMADGGQWMTYAALAEARGITRKAAVRMTQRHRWRRTPGNDGTVRVLVPNGMAGRQTPRLDALPGGRLDALPGGRLDARLADSDAPGKDQLIAGLRADLTEANRRASDAVSLADRALTMLADAEARAREAEQAARIATDALKAARLAEEARTARGLVARLRAAWRGE
jgi:hypothetical protein